MASSSFWNWEVVDWPGDSDSDFKIIIPATQTIIAWAGPVLVGRAVLESCS